MLLEGKNTGFVIATPIGLFIAGGFAAASALDLERRGATVMRHRGLIRNSLLAVIAAWAALSSPKWAAGMSLAAGRRADA